MQLPLGLDPGLPGDAYSYGTRSDGGVHGLVHTKPGIVELILDLAGYQSDRDLTSLRLLEPSCGVGAFLIPAVHRLMAAATRQGVSAKALSESILAFDIDPDHVDATRNAILEVLLLHKVPKKLGKELTSKWVQQGDFLLAGGITSFDVIVGNPPYIRIEQLSPALQAEYRNLFATIYDRADLYVAFIEKSLHLLSRKGVLGFICADRWTLNKYGAPLRELITGNFEVRTYIDLHHASPFESDVIAYPSIFVIGREHLNQPTRVASMTTAKPADMSAALLAKDSSASLFPGISVVRFGTWFTGDEPWVISSPEQLSALRSLEERFPLLEHNETASVRIGVATGNDKVYIVPAGIDIEADRLVPLVMREDINDGKIRQATRFIINTFEDGSGIVDLANYPRLRKYLNSHELELRQRHVAKKNKAGWFRTIDRVYPDLVSKPKLLIPDIAGANEVVFDEGRFHPHHNLYYITSNSWDLEVLGGLLSSKVALFFVWSYAVKMRGGYLRFQAQYLRRIRVPKPNSLSKKLCTNIRTAFRSRDFKRLDQLAMEAYELTELPEFEFVDTRN